MLGLVDAAVQRGQSVLDGHPRPCVQGHLAHKKQRPQELTFPRRGWMFVVPALVFLWWMQGLQKGRQDEVRTRERERESERGRGGKTERTSERVCVRERMCVGERAIEGERANQRTPESSTRQKRGAAVPSANRSRERARFADVLQPCHAPQINAWRLSHFLAGKGKFAAL